MNKELNRAHYGKQNFKRMQEQKFAYNMANKYFQPDNGKDQTFREEFARRWQMNEEELEQSKQKYQQYENTLKKLQLYYLSLAKFGEHHNTRESEYEQKQFNRMRKHKKINQFNSFQEFSLN